MSRYLGIAAVAGAVVGLGMSLVFNGIESIGEHAICASLTACLFMVPGFLIWLSVRQAESRRS